MSRAYQTLISADELASLLANEHRCVCLTAEHDWGNPLAAPRYSQRATFKAPCMQIWTPTWPASRVLRKTSPASHRHLVATSA